MKHVLRALFDMYETPGKIALALGLIGLCASAVMAFFFGVQISWTHGVFLVVVAIGAAVGPHLAHNVWHVSKTAGAVVALCCVPLLAIEFYTHMGYTAGLRGVNIGDAKVQQARYTGAYDAVNDDEDALKREKGALDQLKLANRWATTVTADALRAELPPIEAAMKREAKNCGRRKCLTEDDGKGPAWLALAKQKADLEGKIAIAEERNGIAIRIADLEKRLGERRTTAATTEFKHSAADHQAAALVKLVAMVYSGTLKASDMQSEAVEQSVNTGMALAATGFPALFLFIASFFLVRRLREVFPPGRSEASEPAPTPSRVASPSRSWREMYNAHCRTIGVAPVAA